MYKHNIIFIHKIMSMLKYCLITIAISIPLPIISMMYVDFLASKVNIICVV